MRNNDLTNNRKAKAWGITIGIHAVLLLIFLVWKYDFPAMAKPAEEDLLEVALGTDMDGLGEDPDMDMEDPAAAHDQQATDLSSASKPIPSEEQQIETSDAPDVPNTVKIKKTTPVELKNKKTIEQPVKKPVTTPSKNTKPNTANNTNASSNQVKGKYVMDGANGKGGNQASENKSGTGSGNTFGSGTKGTPGGNPNGKLYVTNPFKDRVFERTPSPNAKYNQGGKVTVRVTIDRNGNITNSSITAPNAELRALAANKLKDIKFKAAPNALPSQSGNIIFNFTTGGK